MRVLVVEDEKKTASFIRKALQTESFAVDVMTNGEDALLAAAGTPFDAIILDIMLPGRDGLSVLRQLRERKNTTPVLLLSARGKEQDRRRVFSLAQLAQHAQTVASRQHDVEDDGVERRAGGGDRKSTRLNSSHITISYA